MSQERLSRREKQVIDLMTEGHSNKEIAARLGLCEGTIKVYASKIYWKCPEIGNRYGAVRLAVRDHERALAIRLDGWIKAHGETLNVAALAGIKSIMADMVAKVLQ